MSHHRHHTRRYKFTEHTSNGTIILSKTITQSDTNGNLTSIRVIFHKPCINSNKKTYDNIIIDTVIIHLYGVNNTISGTILDYHMDAGVQYHSSYMTRINVYDPTALSTIHNVMQHTTT